MGFGGGGGGALPNHEHTNIALDGGPLDFVNTTIASLSAGSTTFSDGAALQELVYPAVPAGETLTAVAASTAPSWVTPAATAPSVEFVDFTQLVSDSTQIDISFASIPMTDISELLITFNADILTTAGVSLRARLNGISSNTYAGQNWRVVSATGAAEGGTGESNWLVAHAALGNRRMGVFHIVAAPTAMTSNETLGATGQSGGQLGNFTWSGYNSTANIHAIDQVTLYISGVAGNQLKAGSNMGIYKINNS